LRVDWEENPGSPVDPAEINGFAFGFDTYPDTPNSGTIWIDNITLLDEEEAYLNPQPIAEAEPIEAQNETLADLEESVEVSESSERTICPGSMALSVLMVAGVGVSFVIKQ